MTNEQDNLRNLLLNFDYLQNRLNVTHPDAIIGDCQKYPDVAEIQLIMSVFSHSRRVLIEDTTQLASQIIGHLGRYVRQSPLLHKLVTDAYRYRTNQPSLKLITATLYPAGDILHHTFDIDVGDKFGITLSVSGDYVAYGTVGGILKVLNWQTGQIVFELFEQDKMFFSIVLSQEHLVTCSWNETTKIGQVRVWDWQTNTIIASLTGEETIQSVVFVDDSTLILRGQRIQVWTWQEQDEAQTIGEHPIDIIPIPVPTLAVSGQYLATASRDTVHIWNWKTGETLQTIREKSEAIGTIVLSDKHVLICIAGRMFGDFVNIYNWQTGKKLHEISTGSLLSSICVADDYFVHTDTLGGIGVWNWKTGELIRTFSKWHPQSTTSVYSTLALQGNYLFVASHTGTLDVWQWKTDFEVENLSGYLIRADAIGALDDYVFIGSRENKSEKISEDDHTIKIWDWRKGRIVRTLAGHTNQIEEMIVSDNYLLSASADHSIRVWDWKTGTAIHTLKGHTWFVRTLAISEQYLLSGSSDKTVRVWNWQTGQLLHTLMGHGRDVNKIALSGEYAVSASTDRTVKVWNWRTGELLRTLNNLSESRYVVLSDEYAITSSNDGTLVVWNWQTGEEIRTLYGVKRPAYKLVLWGDYVVGTSVYELKVWNWRTGEIIHDFQKEYAGFGLEIINGYIVAVSSVYVHIWNIESGQKITSLATDSSLDDVYVSPNCEVIVVGGRSDRLHFVRPNAALRHLLKSSKLQS